MIQRPADLPDDQLEVWQQAVEFFHQAFRLQRQGDPAGAMHYYRMSLRLYPTAEAHTFLGWAYSSLHLYDEAIAACKEAIKVDPAFGNPYNDIGSYLIELDRHQEAVEWLEKALEAPRYAARHYAHFNLGRAHEHLGNWEAALEHYERSLTVNPSYNEARHALNMLRAKLN